MQIKNELKEVFRVVASEFLIQKIGFITLNHQLIKIGIQTLVLLMKILKSVLKINIVKKMKLQLLLQAQRLH